jgi:hypothetical protein
MGLTKAEAEDRARRLLKKAGMDMFMEIESLACCRESNRVFLVLKCKGVTDAENSDVDNGKTR